MLADPVNFSNLNFVLNIEKERKRISPVSADSKKFAVKFIKLYDAANINPFDEIPECVSQLTYKLDLSNKECISDSRWGELFQLN